MLHVRLNQLNFGFFNQNIVEKSVIGLPRKDIGNRIIDWEKKSEKSSKYHKFSIFRRKIETGQQAPAAVDFV